MIIHGDGDGDGDGDGQGHVSVYLTIIGKSSLHALWEECRGIFAISRLSRVSRNVSYRS